ncbi:hypothetical protein F4778DRAFT_729119 [Xylariomycetidae sp. FL2044]|nr:hypothetical protein F4778DRAFT_729119 [Xylariomycetidae sp. FL2044]
MYQEIWSVPEDEYCSPSEPTGVLRAVILWTFVPAHKRKDTKHKTKSTSGSTTWRFLTKLGPSSPYHLQRIYVSDSSAASRGTVKQPDQQPDHQHDACIGTPSHKHNTQVHDTTHSTGMTESDPLRAQPQPATLNEFFRGPGAVVPTSLFEALYTPSWYEHDTVDGRALPYGLAGFTSDEMGATNTENPSGLRADPGVAPADWILFDPSAPVSWYDDCVSNLNSGVSTYA